jgi:hypothetical protein
LLLNQ